MRSTCDDIAATLAEHARLSDAHRRHIEKCDACRDLAGLPDHVARASRTAEPRVGFESRATAGAIERLAHRRRRRVGIYASVAAAAGAAAIAAVWIARDEPATGPDRVDPLPAVSTDTKHEMDTAVQPGELTSDELTELIELSDVERSLSFAADWDDIEMPLAPLRAAAGEGEQQ